VINIASRKVQYFILGAIGTCILVFLFLQFLILPLISSWREDSAKTAEIQQKNAEMRRVVQSSSAIQQQIDLAQRSLANLSADIPLPVLGNYLLNMEEYIRRCSSNSSVNVVNIADNDVLEISPGIGSFKVYRVRVQARGGFNELVQFVENIHRGNSLASLSGVNIMARDDDPIFHEIGFIVSWLIWIEPAKRPVYKAEKQQ
jgi:hypothetical protein